MKRVTRFQSEDGRFFDTEEECLSHESIITKPIRLKLLEIDLSALITICQEHIDFIDNDEEYHEDNDDAHYIFESAVETVFGKGVFEWINNRHK